MKIAIDARFYGYENGGLGRYTISLLDELQKIDLKNNYYVLLRSKYYDSLNFTNNFIKVRADARHYSLKEQILIPFLLYKINPDITHFLHFNVPILYFRKYIVTIHDLLMHGSIGKEATTRNLLVFKIKRRFYRIVFDLCVNRALKIIVPTNFVKEELLKTYSKNKGSIIVIYEGVSTSFTADNLNLKITKKPYFLYVGNAYPHKNISTIFEALLKLPKEVHLSLVIPRDVFKDRLIKQIDKLNIRDRVSIKSGVTDPEIAVLYSRSIGFVYASFSEGFGLQGLEAMKSKTRLIASNIPVFHEVYKDNALYFNPYDSDDLANMMQFAIDEKKIVRQKALKKANEFVLRYSWTKMTRDTLSIYGSR